MRTAPDRTGYRAIQMRACAVQLKADFEQFFPVAAVRGDEPPDTLVARHGDFHDAGEFELAVIDGDAADLTKQLVRTGKLGDGLVGLAQRSVQIGEAGDVPFVALARADVAKNGLDRRPACKNEIPGGGFDIERRAVEAQVFQLGHRCVGSVLVHALRPGARNILEVGMHDRKGIATENLRDIFRSECNDGGLVGEYVGVVAVHDQGVGRQFHQLAVALIGLAAGKEFPDHRTRRDGRHDQRLAGCPGFPAEKFHGTHRSSAGDQRKRECRTQSGCEGGWRTPQSGEGRNVFD